jgi:hypothetical protein
VILRFNKDPQIEFLLNFREILHEQSFDDKNRGRLELKYCRFSIRIIE